MSTGAMQQPTGPHTDVSTIPGIVSDLRANFRTGHTRPLEWRRRELGKLRDLFTENTAEIQEALAKDLGKPSVLWLDLRHQGRS